MEQCKSRLSVYLIGLAVIVILCGVRLVASLGLCSEVYEAIGWRAPEIQFPLETSSTLSYLGLIVVTLSQSRLCEHFNLMDRYSSAVSMMAFLLGGVAWSWHSNPSDWVIAWGMVTLIVLFYKSYQSDDTPIVYLLIGLIAFGLVIYDVRAVWLFLLWGYSCYAMDSVSGKHALAFMLGGGSLVLITLPLFLLSAQDIYTDLVEWIAPLKPKLVVQYSKLTYVQSIILGLLTVGNMLLQQITISSRSVRLKRYLKMLSIWAVYLILMLLLYPDFAVWPVVLYALTILEVRRVLSLSQSAKYSSLSIFLVACLLVSLIP